MSSPATRRTARIAVALLLALALAAQIAPPARAQDGKRADVLAWDDAPSVPRFRSEADWLIDVGRSTYAEVYGPFPTREYAVGDTEQFRGLSPSEGALATFVLHSRTEHAYFWFEDGVSVDEASLDAAARYFEDHIWPMNNAIYGDEWIPGIDGDSRLHILHQATINASVVGAFNPVDQCPRFLCPDSNQREILYVNLDLAPVNSQPYLATLTHEHQHLIQHHVDGNEERWLNEGLSQLAEHLAGFHPRYISGENMRDFLRNPDHHLNGWTFTGYDMGRYYGAAYLWTVYLYERFGLDFIRHMASHPHDGLAGIQHALVETGAAASVDEVFADWILANYLDDPYVGDGRFYYQTLDLPIRIRPRPLDLAVAYPRFESVNQYGAVYSRLDRPGVYDVSFDGADQASPVSMTPHSGSGMWWSYNAINGAARLTGAFDLAGLDAATLVFNGWWAIEDEYDWLHVLVSGDGGASWSIVGGDRAQRDGSNAPGLYYAGESEGWVEERIDLSDYAGGPVLIRFEYLTDGTASFDGVVLDDVGIAELGYRDDAESDQSVWAPDGFLRITGTVPQHWTVAVVTHGPAGRTTVERVALDALNTGRARVTVPDGGSVTLVVGAMAPFTSAEARYKLTVQPAED